MTIIRNSAHCTICDEEIVSLSRHDFKECSGGHIGVDGGNLYLRRSARDPLAFLDTSIIDHHTDDRS